MPRRLDPDTLSPIDLAILSLLMAHDGQPPNVRQVAAATGLSLHGAHLRLGRLRKLGLVAWTDGRARTLTAACRFSQVG